MTTITELPDDIIENKKAWIVASNNNTLHPAVYVLSFVRMLAALQFLAHKRQCIHRSQSIDKVIDCGCATNQCH